MIKLQEYDFNDVIFITNKSHTVGYSISITKEKKYNVFYEYNDLIGTFDTLEEAKEFIAKCYPYDNPKANQRKEAKKHKVLEAYKDLKKWAAEGYSWGCTCKEDEDNYENAIKVLDEHFKLKENGNE